MRIPDCLASLHDQGIITDVLRPLMSGKEAQIYLVTMGEKLCVAKVYKDAQHRSFRHRADYTEGRKVRNTRDQRAMTKRSRYGREQEEAGWRSTEVDVIYRLHAGGVRVPAPYHFIDGVLLMELVTDAEGNPAPRLGDIQFEPEEATRIYYRLMREVVRMLCAGVVHGDLSDFNVLLGADGPVIIDFPQSVDTAHNRNARQLLLRDVDNLHRFLVRFAPNARRLPYAEEMWELHQRNALLPDTQLAGRFQAARQRTDIRDVLGLVEDADRDQRRRRDLSGQRGGPRPYDLAGSRTERPRPSGSRVSPPQETHCPPPQIPLPIGVNRPNRARLSSDRMVGNGTSSWNQRRNDTDGGQSRRPNNGPPSNAAPGFNAQRSAGSRGTRPRSNNKAPGAVEVIVLRRPAR